MPPHSSPHRHAVVLELRQGSYSIDRVTSTSKTHASFQILDTSPAKAVYTQDRNYLGRSANKWELAPDIWMPIFSAGSIKSVNPWYIPETKRRRHVFWVWYRTSLSKPNLIVREYHMATFLITGGAGFIGSHLTEAALALGHRVLVLDDLSSGSIENLAAVRNHKGFEFIPESVTEKRV